MLKEFGSSLHRNQPFSKFTNLSRMSDKHIVNLLAPGSLFFTQSQAMSKLHTNLSNNEVLHVLDSRHRMIKRKHKFLS
jgi:hypothetical protein